MPTTTKLPYGLGSIAKRGRLWWLMFHDTYGNRIQKSTGTDDQQTAIFMLGVEAMAVLAGRSYEIEKIVKAASRRIQGQSEEPARDGGESTGRRRSVPKYEKGHRKGAK